MTWAAERIFSLANGVAPKRETRTDRQRQYWRSRSRSSDPGADLMDPRHAREQTGAPALELPTSGSFWAAGGRGTQRRRLRQPRAGVAAKGEPMSWPSEHLEDVAVPPAVRREGRRSMRACATARSRPRAMALAALPRVRVSISLSPSHRALGHASLHRRRPHARPGPPRDESGALRPVWATLVTAT